MIGGRRLRKRGTRGKLLSAKAARAAAVEAAGTSGAAVAVVGAVVAAEDAARTSDAAAAPVVGTAKTVAGVAAETGGEVAAETGGEVAAVGAVVAAEDAARTDDAAAAPVGDAAAARVGDTAQTVARVAVGCAGGTSSAAGPNLRTGFCVPVDQTAVEMRKHLHVDGRGYLIHRGAVPGGVCARVLRAVAVIAGSAYRIIFNHQTVDDFESDNTTVASIMASGGGGLLMAKLGGLVPDWLGTTVDREGVSTPGILLDAEAQLWADFCLVASVFLSVAGRAFGRGGYQCIYGPSLLQSRGVCLPQLPHIDQSVAMWNGKPTKLAPMNPSKPNLSLIVPLQDNTRVVVYPHSHRYLPSQSGGHLSVTIDPAWVALNRGDALLFRQDLVHHGAPSTGINHRVHWYIDAGRKASKLSTFYVNSIAKE
ncbi:hypothetical protein BU14_0093s0035 [Porphyra umbilicalis]|uniref:Uncharacterized protein n=1 Tax=Porphyra umbilicalis TaxID=2786 RepID=A0A1X6PDP8_PORUM|nr:hypothetical protein BU14_0093s0035 [Porphyra umbilicalis]|eukprot:OSX78992.1 hypothetical protein BU14_0093s0035 [Porphyra umbilicalis]